MKHRWIVIALVCCPGIAFAQTELKLTASDAAAGDQFGCSVSVDGDTAVVGARLNDDDGSDSGSVYIFTRNAGGSWTLQAELTASDAAAGDHFGYAVSIAGDTVVIGAHLDDDDGNGSGSAYVFIRSEGTWTQQAKLTADDAGASDKFGRFVSVDGDTAVIGAWQDRPAGSAYVFTRSGVTWTQQAKLTASDAGSYDSFGKSVSVDGDTAVVGADNADGVGSNSGAAYVFTRTGSTWTQHTKLTATDAAAADQFGVFVSVNSDTAVVGAIGDDDSSGSAYVFTRNGGTWSQQAKLSASDAATYDLFGISVSIDGDTAVVGAFGDDDSGSMAGSAYIFTRDGSSWKQQAKLTASDAATNDFFGRFLSVDGDTAVVGADSNDDAGSSSGSAYIYTLCDQKRVLTAGQWELVSLPCSPNATVEGLFGDDDLGVYGTDWALVERVESSDSYRQLLIDDPVEQGEGYWIKVLGGTPSIDVFGSPTDDTHDFDIELVGDATAPGRANLVGHPFTFDQAWGEVEVVDGVTVVPLSNTASGTYINNRTMWTYDAGYTAHNPDSPINPGTLSTFEGFWVRALADVELRIPSSAPASPTKRQSTTGGIGSEAWWVQIGVAADADGIEDAGNGFGRLTGSSDGFDEQDLEELEPMGAPYLTLVFPHEDWGLPIWSYTTDFRDSAFGVGGRWNMEVRSDTAREVTLSWSIGGAADGVLSRSALIDQESGEIIDPLLVSSYSTVLVDTEHALAWRVNTLPMVKCPAPTNTTIGFPVVLSAAISDADEDDTHTAMVNWGDGLTVPAVVDDINHTLSAQHTFYEAGEKRISVCVDDAWGGQGCDTATAIVEANPNWIFGDGFESGGKERWSGGN